MLQHFWNVSSYLDMFGGVNCKWWLQRFLSQIELSLIESINDERANKENKKNISMLENRKVTTKKS